MIVGISCDWFYLLTVQAKSMGSCKLLIAAVFISLSVTHLCLNALMYEWWYKWYLGLFPLSESNKETTSYMFHTRFLDESLMIWLSSLDLACNNRYICVLLSPDVCVTFSARKPLLFSSDVQVVSERILYVETQRNCDSVIAPEHNF